MPKPFRVAGEADSWCTRCRLVLNHRIVSMKNAKPHQVECLTCRAQHLWRPAAPGDRAQGPAKSDGGDRPQRAHSTRPPRMTHAMRHAEQWEKAIAGRSMSEFKTYSVGGSFHEGDLVRHRRFGDGVVTRVIDAHKVEVLFRDEAKTLAQGLN
jgi:hypothetical protein